MPYLEHRGIQEHVIWPLIRYTPALKLFLEYHVSKPLLETLKPVLPLIQDASFQNAMGHISFNEQINEDSIHERIQRMPLEKRQVWVDTWTRVICTVARDQSLLEEVKRVLPNEAPFDLLKEELSRSSLILVLQDESKVKDALSEKWKVSEQRTSGRTSLSSPVVLHLHSDSTKDIVLKWGLVVMTGVSMAAALGLALKLNDHHRQSIQKHVHDS